MSTQRNFRYLSNYLASFFSSCFRNCPVLFVAWKNQMSQAVYQASSTFRLQDTEQSQAVASSLLIHSLYELEQVLDLFSWVRFLCALASAGFTSAALLVRVWLRSRNSDLQASSFCLAPTKITKWILTSQGCQGFKNSTRPTISLWHDSVIFRLWISLVTRLHSSLSVLNYSTLLPEFDGFFQPCAKKSKGVPSICNHQIQQVQVQVYFAMARKCTCAQARFCVDHASHAAQERNVLRGSLFTFTWDS